ncbi:hypothetical protein [Streptomyces sp. NPDC055099]
MDTASLLLIGAAGGAVRGIVHAYDCMSEWLVRRQEFRIAEQPEAEKPPAFSSFYDVAGESIAAVVHITLGAGVALLMASWGQISGGFATFAVGASAPVLLVQLKHSRLAEAVIGDPNAPEAPQPPVPGLPDAQGGPPRPAAGPRGAE